MRAPSVSSMVLFSLLFTPLFALQVAPQAHADEANSYQPADFISAPLEHPDEQSGVAAWRLGLKEALTIASKNNLGIVLERESLEVSKLNIDIARGEFEPTVTGSYGRTDADRFATRIVEGPPGSVVTDKTHVWRVGLEKKFVTGTTVGVAWQNIRNTSISDDSPPPFYGSDLELSLTQPLLRGASLDLKIPKIGVLRAKLGTKRQRENARATLLAVTEATETAYWSLTQALKTYQVRRASQKLAEAQMELTTRQINAGVLAKADAIEAESTLARRELELITAKKDIDAASDRMRAVLNLPRQRWSEPILPIDSPSYEPRTSSDSDALKLALTNRPEARSADLEIKEAEYSIREANNSRLPQLDLGLNYGLGGQGERYRSALNGISDRTAPSWTVFLSLTWTPLNRAAGARAKIADSNARIAKAKRDQAVLSIHTEVREATRNLDSAAKQLSAAARFRSLSERSLDAEQRKFRAGTSSNFLVAERSESVAQSQLAELGALIAHRLASLELLRATGELLAARQIRLE